MINLQYVGVGTGRCGTVFLARYLTSVGIKCGHEYYFDRDNIEEATSRLKDPGRCRSSMVGGGEWLKPGDDVIADSSYMAAPYLDSQVLSEAAVIHLIRNPLQVLSSFHYAFKYFASTTSITTYERFIYQQIPSLYEEMHPLERCCLFLIEWNRMIEAKSASKRRILHRIEDDPRGVLEFVGNPPHDPRGVFGDRTANSIPKQMCSISDIPAGSIREGFLKFCHQYGYGERV